MVRDAWVVLSLDSYVSNEATGELIFVTSDDFEAHLYFQRGRIAWATCTGDGRGFNRRLKESCGIEQDALSEVIETCSREKRPLGETLIRWGMSTPEDVKEALSDQITATLLRLLERRDIYSRVFLSRKSFTQYDSSLTFSLEEVLKKVNSQTAPETRRDATPTGIFQLLKGRIDGLRWIELRDEVGLSHHPAEHRPCFSRGWGDELIDAQAQFACLRTDRGSVVAGHRGNGETIALGVAPETNLSRVLSAAFPSSTSIKPVAAGLSPADGQGWVFSGENTEELRRAQSTIESTDELKAVFVVAQGEVQWSVRRRTFSIEFPSARATKSSQLLKRDMGSSAFTSRFPSVNRMAGYCPETIVIACIRNWLFGCSLPDGSGRTLWICLDRGISQGLGWALLPSLSQLLVSIERAG